MQTPSPLTQTINVALELSADNDTLRGQNERLRAEVQDHRQALDLACAAIDQATILHVGLSDDLDDTRAEWAAEIAMLNDVAAFNRAHIISGAGHSTFGVDGISLTTNQELLERISEMETRLTQAKAERNAEQELAEVMERQRDEANKSVAHWAERFEDERRQKVAAFERNSQLEREMRGCAQTLRAIVTDKEPSPDLLGLAARLDPPRAPSVPRHRFEPEAEALR